MKQFLSKIFFMFFISGHSIRGFGKDRIIFVFNPFIALETLDLKFYY